MQNDNIRIAAAYIRVSTDEQTELSPDSQLKLIREYANTHNMVLPDKYVFADEGITGRKTDKRDGFNKMIGTAKQKPKPFDVILLWKFSRFARNREDSVVYKSMLRKQLGIDVISISEPTGDDKMSVLIEALIEAMDEYYSINLSEEVLRGMKENALRGNLQSAPPFGYTVKDHVLEPIEQETKIVNMIFQDFVNGDGFYTIAKKLNAMGVKTHRGNLFENRTVEYIIRNPVYIGKLRWNPTGKSRRDFENPNIILSDAKHKAIIDLQLWEAAQKRANEIKALWRPRYKPPELQRSWMSGLIRCAECGRSLISSFENRYWKCEGYSKGRCKYSQHTTTQKLESMIISRLEIDSIESAELAYSIVNKKSTSTPDLNALVTRKQKLLVGIERVREAYLFGTDTLEEYTTTVNKLKKDIQKIDEQIAGLQKTIPKKQTDQQMKTAISNTLAILKNENATKEEKQNAARSVISHCIWNKQSNTFVVVYQLILMD